MKYIANICRIEPEVQDCENNRLIHENDYARYYGIWYPQMGGYGAKAVVEIQKNSSNNSCIEVAVWHDGDFPFHEGEHPAILHHCSADQFIRFGEKVSALRHPDIAGGNKSDPICNKCHSRYYIKKYRYLYDVNGVARWAADLLCECQPPTPPEEA